MLAGVDGDVRHAFIHPTTAANVRQLRNDLLLAADGVTSVMASLVKELNSGIYLVTIYSLEIDLHVIKKVNLSHIYQYAYIFKLVNH